MLFKAFFKTNSLSFIPINSISAADKLTFDILAGSYYKYLDRNDMAINFLLRARANDYHWNDELYDYNSLTRDNTLCFEIFDIYLKQNN